jgi:hypothetical protein
MDLNQSVYIAYLFSACNHCAFSIPTPVGKAPSHDSEQEERGALTTRLTFYAALVSAIVPGSFCWPFSRLAGRLGLSGGPGPLPAPAVRGRPSFFFPHLSFRIFYRRAQKREMAGLLCLLWTFGAVHLHLAMFSSQVAR